MVKILSQNRILKKTKEKKAEVKRIHRTNLNVVDNRNQNDTTSRDNINNTTSRTNIKTQSEFSFLFYFSMQKFILDSIHFKVQSFMVSRFEHDVQFFHIFLFAR